MPIRDSKREASPYRRQKSDTCPSSNPQRLDTVGGELSEKQVYKITKRREIKSTRKMRDEIKKSDNTILRVLFSLSVNSPNDGYVSPIAELTPEYERMKTVQTTSRGLESDRRVSNWLNDLSTHKWILMTIQQKRTNSAVTLVSE